MRPKSIVLLVVALGCGLIASIGINQAMTKPVPTQLVEGETTQIVVAKTDIQIGDPIKSEVINLEAWPKDKVPPGALTSLDDVIGRRARTRLFAGEPIIDQKLLGKGETGEDAVTHIPKGMRVVSIRVDAVSGAANLIKPGNRVDVMVHLQENPQRGIMKTTTQTFLQHIKVFAVDDVFRRDTDGTTSNAKTVSLLVTPEQAEKVMMATELGTVRLAMRSADDDVDMETAGASVHDFPGVSLPKPEPTTVAKLPETKPEAKPEPKPEPPPIVHLPPADVFKMRVIEADSQREVEFANGVPVNVNSSQQSSSFEQTPAVPAASDSSTDPAATTDSQPTENSGN